MQREFYHILNRGVDKRIIYNDKRDYRRFIHDLFEFNDESNAIANGYFFSQSLDIGCPKVKVRDERKLLLELHSFALMPNHYHLLVSPLVHDGIPRFMQKLNMGYAKYFNERNNRSGTLFQGKYKSVHIRNDRHFNFILYYIHFNPLDLKSLNWRDRKLRNPSEAFNYLETYPWSSHMDYLGKNNVPAVTQRKFFLDYFGGNKGYRKAFRQELNNFSIIDGENADITLE
ncbi:transposase [bacterium]|nr:transposase [bacterium]